MDFLVMSQNKKFYNYPSHSHDYWEVLINMEGEGTAIVDGREYPFHPGSIFCIRPGTMHSKESEDGFVDGGIMISDFCFETETENILVFEDDERRSFYCLFQLVFDYPLKPSTDVYGEKYLRSMIEAMQNLLCHWKDDTNKNEDVLRIQKIMFDHVSDRTFDIETLLETTPYSPNYFRKLFKEQSGCSPLQFYNGLKIQLAKKQILQHKSILSVNEIARECGFEDPYYFSRLFKKMTGKSPMQFYKQSSEEMTMPIEKNSY